MAVGSEDGYIYTFDARKALGFVEKIPTVPKGSPSTAKSPVTDVALEGARKIYASTLDGKLFVFV